MIKRVWVIAHPNDLLDKNTHLNVPYGRVQNRQVGRFLLIRLERELLLQRLEALLQMGPSILLQLVVHFSRTNAAGKGQKESRPKVVSKK